MSKFFDVVWNNRSSVFRLLLSVIFSWLFALFFFVQGNNYEDALRGLPKAEGENISRAENFIELEKALDKKLEAEEYKTLSSEFTCLLEIQSIRQEVKIYKILTFWISVFASFFALFSLVGIILFLLLIYKIVHMCEFT